MDNKPTYGFNCYFQFIGEKSRAQVHKASSVVDLGLDPKLACLPRLWS